MMQQRINIGNRLASMILDHFIMSFVIMIFMLPGMAISMFNDSSHNMLYSNGFGLLVLYAFGFSIYLNKDFFNGQSGAKRILKMQVIDQKTNQAASPLKCFVRNLILPLWPLEVIFVLINPKRRLGDRIAGTRIEYLGKPEEVKISWMKLVLVLVLGTIYISLILLPFLGFMGF